MAASHLSHDGLRPPVELACPACRAPVLPGASGVACDACGRSFGRTGGFLDLIVGERFDDPSDDVLLAYEEQSNRDLTLNYWIPLFRRLWPSGPRPPRVLSVGCGTGVDVELLHQAGFESVGIDCGNRVQVWPRRGAPERLLMANGKHLPFPDASFDAVFCGCVFPHVGVVGDTAITAPDCGEQRAKLAAEMGRVLRPGGRVVVASPNRWFPFDIFHGRAPGSYKVRFNPPTQRFLLSLGDYDRLFRASGCGPATALPVEGYWGFIRSRHSLRGYVLGLPVRFAFWLVSRPAFAFLRPTPLAPWLVVMAQKTARGPT
jgi:SAM-dependent methyltransferase